MGSIYQRGTIWWIKYYRDGVPMRESSESEQEGVAKKLLKQREGDIVRGLPITPRTNRVTFDELAADVINDYKVNGKRAINEVRRNIEKHLNPIFKGWRAAAISTADVRKYIAQRQAEGAANATINRELAALKRAFSLGIEAGKLTVKPKIPMLDERDNVRTGFFEHEQFESVRAHLPEPLQGVVGFAYVTGWRVPSEVLPLEWRQVDFTAATVRLDAGTTKNREGRLFLFTAELRALLERQREYTRRVERERGIICKWVFHRNGERIKDFRGAWDTACKKAGCPVASRTTSGAQPCAIWSGPVCHAPQR